MLDKQDVKLFDIRDVGSFQVGHIPGAERLTQESLSKYADSADLSTPIIVYCYHGVSSQAAADFLVSRGFKEVFSLEGGFEAWRAKYDVNKEH